LKITSQPRVVTIKGKQVVKSGYSTESAPNAVTGKRVLLLVDRYQLVNKGKPVTVDLGTPKGVDNVDAYRMMIESFKSSFTISTIRRPAMRAIKLRRASPPL